MMVRSVRLSTARGAALLVFNTTFGVESAHAEYCGSTKATTATAITINSLLECARSDILLSPQSQFISHHHSRSGGNHDWSCRAYLGARDSFLDWRIHRACFFL